METLQKDYFKHRHGYRPDFVDDTLYVLSPINNPGRYRARWNNFNNFQKHIIDSGAHLITIECSTGERNHVYIDKISEKHTVINLRSNHFLWVKENLLNVGIQHLTNLFPNWKYVAMIDGDMTFVRHDWVGECLHQLQVYPIVQMYSQIANLGPDEEVLSTGLSFMEGWRQGIPFKNKNGVVFDGSYKNRNKYGDHCDKHKIGWAGSPGGAWAYRRQALSALGGLIEVAILGSADYHMATALMGFCHISMGNADTSEYHPEYIQYLLRWQDRALKAINRNVGHMKGTMFHHWHGAMRNRGYLERWKILIKHQYNPNTDIFRDVNGVLQLGEDKWQLRDDVRDYMFSRNEDGIDL